MLNDDVVASSSPLEERRAAVTATAQSHAETYRGKVDYIYETAIKGYAIELPDEAAAIALSQDPQVQWVEEDVLSEWSQAQVQPNFTHAQDESTCRPGEIRSCPQRQLCLLPSLLGLL